MHLFIKKVLFFLFGILVGTSIYLFVIQSSINLKRKPAKNTIFVYPKAPDISNYENWFEKQQISRTYTDLDTLRYSSSKLKLESEWLFGVINILCVIFVRNKRNAEAAQNTWAKSCNSLSFIEVSAKKRLVRPRKEDTKWYKLCSFIKSLKTSAQWIVFVNDQTFVLLENLRLLVADKNHTDGYYLGQAVRFWNTSYNEADSGFVISEGALNKLQNSIKSDKCTENAVLLNKEDLYLGKLLGNLGIPVNDTRDSLGYSRFHSYNWQQEFFSGLNYYKKNVLPPKCCSIYPITFKGIDAEKFYMYYYLIYQLKVFKEGLLGSKPQKEPKDIVWKTFLLEQGINRSVSAQEYYKIWENLVQDPEKFLQEMH